MKKIKQQFTLHPVGQGLFYSGSLKYKVNDYLTRNFSFVFDCGSERKRNCLEEVKKFREDIWMAEEPLDLLVISHFHSDHINCIGALLDGRKVRRIVAPFVNFTDRLSTALLFRISPDYSDRSEQTDFTLRLMIDPVATLEPYLSEGGEIVFLQSDEIKPFEPYTGNEASEIPPDAESGFETEFPADLEDLSPSEGLDLRCFGNARIKKITDSSPVFLKLGIIRVMEFLFFRKPAGQAEQGFYTTIYDLFTQRFARINAPVKSSTEYLLRILAEKEIARVITEIFKKARKAHPDLAITLARIQDLNTTALSMLHYNLQALYNYFPRTRTFDNTYFHSSILKKLDSTDRVLCEAPLVYDCGYYLYHHQHYYNFPFDPHRKFPNTLLTSDIFLRNTEDLELFYTKFKLYWNKFWLFQLPHHGSKNNIDRALLTQLSFDIFLFVNFGVRNRNEHPSNEVINDIILTRHADKLLEVNEYTGLLFGLQIDCYE